MNTIIIILKSQFIHLQLIVCVSIKLSSKVYSLRNNTHTQKI